LILRVGVYRDAVLTCGFAGRYSRLREGVCMSRFAIMLCLCSISVGPAHAQSTTQSTMKDATEPAEPAGYTELLDQALEERNAGHFEEAHALFARAHAMFPNARTLRALGMVEFDLRDYRTSVEYLEQALASQVRPLTAPMRQSVSELLERAKGFLGKVALSVEPSDAQVELDGAPIQLGDQPLLLNFGEHTFDITASGFARATRKVNVRAGEPQTLHVVLDAEAPSATTTTADASRASEPAASQHDRTDGPGALPWVLVGISGALMVTGGVLVGLAQGDIAEVEDAKRGTRWSEVADAYDAAPVKSGIGFALLGVGAAGLVGSLIWALRGPSEKPAQTAALHVGLSPAGACLSGAF
jgi:hypothetical protein